MKPFRKEEVKGVGRGGGWEMEKVDLVRSTQEAIECGAVTRILTGRIVALCRDENMIRVKIKGQGKPQTWHSSFWMPFEPNPVPLEREDLWGEQRK